MSTQIEDKAKDDTPVPVEETNNVPTVDEYGDLDTNEPSVETRVFDEVLMASEIAELDEGEIPVYNKERMSRLLDYLLCQPEITQVLRPHTNVAIIEAVFEGMSTLGKMPDNSIIASNHTVGELTELNKRLWRTITASQFQRVKLRRAELEELYERIPDTNTLITKEEAVLSQYLISSMALIQPEPLDDILREGSWTNVYRTNDRRIGPSIISKHRDPIKNIRSKLNLLSESAFPLLSSGLVLKVASPGAIDETLLNDNLVASKIDTSLASYGHSLESTAVYNNEILVEHAFRQIEETNLGDISRDAFEEQLSILDLESLYMGLAIASYPNGFDVIRQCTSATCGEVQTIRVNPRRMVIYRDDRLSERHVRHLSKNLAPSDASELETYRDTLNVDIAKYLKVEEGIFIKFQTPSFAEYKRVSRAWLDHLTDRSMELLKGSQDETYRRKYVEQALAKSALMMYSHWIEGIYVQDENGDYQPSLTRLRKTRGVTSDSISKADREVDDFLSDISMEPTLHKLILEGVVDYIKRSTLTVHAMPRSLCSKCNSAHTVEGEDIGEEMISFNVAELFFTLLHQRTIKR